MPIRSAAVPIVLPVLSHHLSIAAVEGLDRTLRRLRGLGSTLAPWFELAVRLRLAQIFFVSGVLKASDWDHAILLATDEYPVSWMDPVTAAYLGASIELIGALLLAIGLGTRIAATGLAALSLVIHLNYVVLDANLFWMVLLGWFMVNGAGRWSLDYSLRRGLGASALPLASGLARINQALAQYCGPLYQSLFRIWLGVAVLVAASGLIAETPSFARLNLSLPLTAAGLFPKTLALAGGVLLVVGFGTRVAVSFLLIAALWYPTPWNPAWADVWYWGACFGFLLFYGAGCVSLDRLAMVILQRRSLRISSQAAAATVALPRVVIVGAGFGGISCAEALCQAPVSVTLIDKRNYHLFQPLLYQVATTVLAPNDIATPIRGMFREHANVSVLLGEVDGVDTVKQEVLVATKRIPYDYLVLATGASHSYFGRDEWAPFAPGLKRIEDATELRRRLLYAFERAESADSEAERKAQLTFLIVGGGPTGVELAGAIAELAKQGMEQEYRHIDPAAASVILVQSAPRILPTFTPALSENARLALERLGVQVRLESRVEHIDGDGVSVSGERIPAKTVFWAAGVVASPAAKWLGAAADAAGRLCVEPNLSVPGLPNVFAVGDTALSRGWDGQSVPGLAPAAKQGGAYVARVILACIKKRTAPGPFHYRHLGSLATIGRKAAIADFGKLRLSGPWAWWLWGAVHLAFLVGLRNRVSVIFDWFWAYLTYRSGTRLITGDTVTNLPSVAKT